MAVCYSDIFLDIILNFILIYYKINDGEKLKKLY